MAALGIDSAASLSTCRASPFDLPARHCRISKKPSNDLRWEHLFKTVLKDGKKSCADPFSAVVEHWHARRMSNCVVGSGGSWLPCSTIAEHSVEGCDHFSHDGDDDDLGFFVGGGEAFVEGFEGGTVTACAEGGHVEDVTDRHPTTVDAAVSLELAAVEVIGCEADEGGDLFAAHLPEFWQQGDEREGQHRADAWHRGQQLIALSESTI